MDAVIKRQALKICKLEQKQIRIEAIRKKDLYEFAMGIPEKPEFSAVAPISLLRAGSQVMNPYAKDDDIVLFVAYQGDRCIGYHGLLPGLLKTAGGFSKINWSTAIFVSPHFRGHGIMGRLFSRIKTLNEDFVVTGMNAQARTFYKRLGLNRLGQLFYFQLFLERLNVFGTFCRKFLSFLERRGIQSPKYLSISDRLAEKIYSIQKNIFYRMLITREIEKVNDIRYREVDQITKVTRNTEKFNNSVSGFYRGVEVINWMIKHPWIVSSDDIQEDIRKYYFSTMRETFKYIALEIFSKKEESFKGYLVLSVSKKETRTVVKMLDFYFENPKDCCTAFILTIKYAHAFLADQVEFPDDPAMHFKRSVLFKHLVKKKDRLYLYFPGTESSPLSAGPGHIAFNYCDGDTPFT